MFLNPAGLLAVGVGLAALIAGAAYLAGSLSVTGACAALVVGGLTFGLGGWPAAALLLGFFISSSLLSDVGKRRKQGLAEKFAKGGRRDAVQVLANGGLAAAMAVGFGLWKSDVWIIAMGGALAAANADTWGTELGVLSSQRPRMILGSGTAEIGASGAVTWVGEAASLAGSALIGLLAAGSMGLQAGLAVLVAGFLGATADSLLGASLQAVYWCPNCQKQTERHPYHSCKSATTLVRGKAWLDNDAVNFAASLTGAICAAGLWFLGA